MLKLRGKQNPRLWRSFKNNLVVDRWLVPPRLQTLGKVTGWALHNNRGLSNDIDDVEIACGIASKQRATHTRHRTVHSRTCTESVDLVDRNRSVGTSGVSISRILFFFFAILFVVLLPRAFAHVTVTKDVSAIALTIGANDSSNYTVMK